MEDENNKKTKFLQELGLSVSSRYFGETGSELAEDQLRQAQPPLLIEKLRLSLYRLFPCGWNPFSIANVGICIRRYDNQVQSV